MNASLSFLAGLALSAFAGTASATEDVSPIAPGERGGAELVLHAAKIITCAPEGADTERVVDNGVVVVRDGRITFVGAPSELPTASGPRVTRDLGSSWLMPGMIDLHTHESGVSLYEANDLNDLVYLANPGLRASSAVQPANRASLDAAMNGVTTVLYIPGSGSNIGGQGVLLKTGFDRYEDCEVRNPGSMKLAQAGNPERFAWGVNRSFMNWHTRSTLERGLAYAKAWKDGLTEIVDPQWEVFRALANKETQISTHTQIYQVVLSSLTMLRQEFGFDVYIDHGTIGAWKLGGMAEELGVPAIVGPRVVDPPSSLFMRVCANGEYEGWRGVAAGYQQAGSKHIGFNTDAPIVSDVEFSLQAALAVRFGFDDTNLDTIRGLTIVPAMAAGIDDKVGSLEAGKHADLIVIDGHLADPRSRITEVYIQGRRIEHKPQHHMGF